MNISSLYERALAAVEAQGQLGKPKLQTPMWDGRSIVIHGAGSFGRDVAAILLGRGANLLGFLDRRGTGQIVIGNLRAYPLGSAQARKWLAQKPVVIIGAFNYAVSIRALAQSLREHGFSDVVTPMECYPHLSGALGWRYWLGTSQDYAEAMPLIEKTYSLWADDESRRLFLETLLYRLESDLTALTTISGDDCQYADPTVPRYQEPLRMVDGGAFLGDAASCLLRHNYKIESLYAFEPDLANFKQLRAAAPAISSSARISIWPCGVWSSTSHLKFSDGGLGASRLSETGTTTVPVVALDDVLIQQPINLIKLDVEGVELHALQGARNIIEKNRPSLAICLYHYPDHLWSIPLWVQKLDLGYRLYYRAHQQNSFDTVLYAIADA